MGVVSLKNRYEITRRKLQDEAFRIATEKKIEGFMASIGWWNGFRKRNNIRAAKDLNNRAADENEDEPLEVDPPVEEEEVDPAVEEGQSDPSGHPAVPDIDPTVEEGQSDP